MNNSTAIAISSSSLAVAAASNASASSRAKEILRKMCTDKYDEMNCRDVCVKELRLSVHKDSSFFFKEYSIMETNTCTGESRGIIAERFALTDDEIGFAFFSVFLVAFISASIFIIKNS